jgi:pimeloyl-ACP methyl ester carboxylesterase
MLRVERPAVMLLHSSGSTARQWHALAEHLQPRYRTLPVEFHGHGDRPAWDDASPMTLADDAELVVPLLERLGGAHLVGHSYGGAVALKVATMRPGLVRSVAAYEPVLFRALRDNPLCALEMQQVLAVAQWMRARLANSNPSTAARRFVEYWSGADAWRYLPPDRQLAISRRMHSVLRHFDALFDEPFVPADLARLEIPMLFLTGAETVAATKRIAYLLKRALPHAQHDVLPSMGHMGPITHAAPFNQRIEQFLNSLGKTHGSSNRTFHAGLRRHQETPASNVG